MGVNRRSDKFKSFFRSGRKLKRLQRVDEKSEKSRAFERKTAKKEKAKRRRNSSAVKPQGGQGTLT